MKQVLNANGEKISKKNYKVTYAYNRNVGTARVIVTFTGDTYSGKLTRTDACTDELSKYMFYKLGVSYNGIAWETVDTYSGMLIVRRYII